VVSLLTSPVSRRSYSWGMTNPTEKSQAKIVLHYHPWSRAAGVRWLLEELGVPYEVRLVDVNAPGGVPESYRAIHPHKKVPAVEVDGEILTERAAITIDLADRFPEARLAPAIGDPLRSAYLRMLVYCDAVFDPCVTARARKLDHAPGDYSFGGFDDLMHNLQNQLRKQPFAAGARFTAADTQLASSLGFTIHQLKVVPFLPEFEAYLARVAQRPAHLRAQELDLALMGAHEGAPGAAAE